VSYENDLIDSIIDKFQTDGRMLNKVKATNVGKGIMEDFPSNMSNNLFPNIRLTWAGTTEEDEPGDDRPPRMRTITLWIHIAVFNANESKRLEDITDLVEVVENVLYDNENALTGLVLDSIDINRVTNTQNLLHPHTVAVMEVDCHTWTTRDSRAGLG
jgi:hypothetical protein